MIGSNTGYLLKSSLHYLGFLPSQLAMWEVEWLIELAWQYIAMIRNNLSIIWISLVQRLHTSLYLENCIKTLKLFLARKSHGTIQFIPLVLKIASFFRNVSFSVSPNVYNFGRENSIQYWNPTIFNIIRWVAGSLGRWDDHLINQASDVPSIFFFIISFKILRKNRFKSFSYFFIILQK